MGLVIFSGFAELTVPPTHDREALVAAIEGLTVGRGTAIGVRDAEGARRDRRGESGCPAGGDAPETTPAPPAAKPGANGYVPDIVVLLTDGANTRGIEPLDAVPSAVERRVRVYPIGFGTTNPAGRACTRTSSAATSSTGSAVAASAAAVGSGRRVRAAFWSPTSRRCKAVATRTGGTYHAAKDADQLQNVFSDLPKEVATQRQRTEVTWIVAALGALLAAAAVAASMRWSPYP